LGINRGKIAGCEKTSVAELTSPCKHRDSTGGRPKKTEEETSNFNLKLQKSPKLQAPKEFKAFKKGILPRNYAEC
jgi:hypothetical protein